MFSFFFNIGLYSAMIQVIVFTFLVVTANINLSGKAHTFFRLVSTVSVLAGIVYFLATLIATFTFVSPVFSVISLIILGRLVYQVLKEGFEDSPPAPMPDSIPNEEITKMVIKTPWTTLVLLLPYWAHILISLV